MRDQLVSAAVFLVLGAVVAYKSVGFGLGTAILPGAGMLPFIIGLFMMLCAVILAIGSLRLKSTEDAEPADWSWSTIARPLGAMGIFAYIVATLNPLGFLLSSWTALILWTRWIHPTGWLSSLVVSTATTAVTYVVFGLWFQIPLPTGSIFS